MTIKRRTAPFRKSDLTSAFEAAKAAGWYQVSVDMETHDGKRLLITARCGPDVSKADMTPLAKWESSHGQR